MESAKPPEQVDDVKTIRNFSEIEKNRMANPTALPPQEGNQYTDGGECRKRASDDHRSSQLRKPAEPIITPTDAANRAARFMVPRISGSLKASARRMPRAMGSTQLMVL